MPELSVLSESQICKSDTAPGRILKLHFWALSPPFPYILKRWKFPFIKLHEHRRDKVEGNVRGNPRRTKKHLSASGRIGTKCRYGYMVVLIVTFRRRTFIFMKLTTGPGTTNPFKTTCYRYTSQRLLESTGGVSYINVSWEWTHLTKYLKTEGLRGC